MHRRLLVLISAAAIATGALSAPALAGSTTEVLPLVGQGLDGDEVGTAWLKRTNNGLSVRVTMPTPGSYVYPPGAVDEGGPEAFTLWVFVFPNPAACGVDGCSGVPDVAASGGGVFGVAGHLSGGGQLTLSGHISKNTTPFALNKLTNPAGAEVHVAVAPHGTLDPAQMPTQIQTPIGDPRFWWLALFK